MEEIHESADSSKEPAEKMGYELRPSHIDAKHVCALAVSSDSIEAPAYPRPSKDDE